MMNVPVVCDYGSGFSKVGFSGTEAPLAMFPTILGKLRHDVSCFNLYCEPCYCDRGWAHICLRSALGSLGGGVLGGWNCWLMWKFRCSCQDFKDSSFFYKWKNEGMRQSTSAGRRLCSSSGPSLQAAGRIGSNSAVQTCAPFKDGHLLSSGGSCQVLGPLWPKQPGGPELT